MPQRVPVDPNNSVGTQPLPGTMPAAPAPAAPSSFDQSPGQYNPFVHGPPQAADQPVDPTGSQPTQASTDDTPWYLRYAKGIGEGLAQLPVGFGEEMMTPVPGPHGTSFPSLTGRAVHLAEKIPGVRTALHAARDFAFPKDPTPSEQAGQISSYVLPAGAARGTEAAIARTGRALPSFLERFAAGRSTAPTARSQLGEIAGRTLSQRVTPQRMRELGDAAARGDENAIRWIAQQLRGTPQEKQQFVNEALNAVRGQGSGLRGAFFRRLALGAGAGAAVSDKDRRTGAIAGGATAVSAPIASAILRAMTGPTHIPPWLIAALVGGGADLEISRHPWLRAYLPTVLGAAGLAGLGSLPASTLGILAGQIANNPMIQSTFQSTGDPTLEEVMPHPQPAPPQAPEVQGPDVTNPPPDDTERDRDLNPPPQVPDYEQNNPPPSQQ